MKKWILVSGSLVSIFILSGFGFETFQVQVPIFLKVQEITSSSAPSPEPEAYHLGRIMPKTANSFIGFREALGFKESGGNYFRVNTFGYLGKYQFGKNTLSLMGVYNKTEFLKNPELQEKVFQINIARNKWILRRDIKWFVGEQMKGLEITESGILAAAHLAGAGNVKRYLRSYGKVDVKDSYGTSIADYMQRFTGYDISNIKAKRRPKI